MFHLEIKLIRHLALQLLNLPAMELSYASALQADEVIVMFAPFGRFVAEAPIPKVQAFQQSQIGQQQERTVNRSPGYAFILLS